MTSDRRTHESSTTPVAVGIFERLSTAEHVAERLRATLAPARVRILPFLHRVRSSRLAGAPWLAVGLGALAMVITTIGATFIGVSDGLRTGLALAAGLLGLGYGLVAGALVGRGQLQAPSTARGAEIEYRVVVAPKPERHSRVLRLLHAEGASQVYTREVDLAA